MGGADPRGAYDILEHVYRNTSARVPNPSQIDMEKARGYFHTLYQTEEPHTPGLTLATKVDTAKVSDKVPFEAEVEAAERLLIPHRVSGHTHLCAEYFKQ